MAVTVSTSTDGILTAAVPSDGSGVLLRVTAATHAHTATIWRAPSTNLPAKIMVRGAAPALLVNRTGFAFDHEVEPGMSWTYWAVLDDGTTSASLTVTVLWGLSVAWLKNVRNPTLSTQVRLVEPYSETHAGRLDVKDVHGGGYAVAHDVEAPPQGTLTYCCNTLGATAGADIYDRLTAALTAGGPLLLQTSAAHGLPPSLYHARTSWERVNPAGCINRAHLHVAASWVGVDRPAPQGAMLTMPGRTWAQVTLGYASQAGLIYQYPGGMWDLALAGLS